MSKTLVVLGAGLMLAGCLTPVATSYRVDGSADAVRAASGQAASRLGWAQHDAEVSSPAAALHLEPREGVLVVTTPRLALHDGALLAATTRLELEHRPGVVPTARSAPLLTVLDVVLPLSGRLLLGPNDAVAAASGRSFWLDLLTRTLMDALAVELVWLSRSAAGSDTSRALFLGGAVFIALVNRLTAVFEDLSTVEARNGFAERGVALPEADEVTRTLDERVRD